MHLSQKEEMILNLSLSLNLFVERSSYTYSRSNKDLIIALTIANIK
jgi:hypothetical protein